MQYDVDYRLHEDRLLIQTHDFAMAKYNPSSMNVKRVTSLRDVLSPRSDSRRIRIRVTRTIFGKEANPEIITFIVHDKANHLLNPGVLRVRDRACEWLREANAGS